MPHRLVVQVVHSAVEVGRLPHQGSHVLGGGPVEEGAPVDVRGLDDFLIVRHLVVGDADVVQLRSLWPVILCLVVDGVLVPLVPGQVNGATGGGCNEVQEGVALKKRI